MCIYYIYVEVDHFFQALREHFPDAGVGGSMGGELGGVSVVGGGSLLH